MKKLILMSFMLSYIHAYPQVIKTYVIGTTIKQSPYKLFTDAATIGDFNIGEKIWITGIEKDFFRSKDNLGRTVFTLQSNLLRPDSLINVFNKELAFIEKIEKEKEDLIRAEEKKAYENVNDYLKKYGSNIDKYCFKHQEIMIGMNKLVFGWVKKEKPISINYTTTKYSKDEQWVYPKYVYYYFSNGKLTAVQDSQ